jgi:ElaB/YqjD/DUF883 family membrane-anchored ribosome-binding protein
MTPQPHRGNGTRRPDEILAEIDRTRGQMDETLSAIEQRLTPGQLVDQGLDYLKNSGAREYAANLGTSLKTHPLPATLTGIGLAWLMAVGSKPAQPSASASEGPSLGERMQSAKERVRSAKERMESGVDSARLQVQRARGGWDYMVREQPLALGAVGLAIGALVAAMAPRTRQEDELMGETRDRLLDDAKRAGSEKLEQAKQAATGGVPDVPRTPPSDRGSAPGST